MFSTTFKAISIASIAALTTLGTSNITYAGDAPWLGEMIMVPYTFCPRGWVEANGATLSINQFQALFSLMGTTYGGDGRTTFGIPDLRGRVPVGHGTGPGLPTVNMGQRGGNPNINIKVQNLPSHAPTITVDASGLTATSTSELKGTRQSADSTVPATNALALAKAQIYSDVASGAPLNATLETGSVETTTTIAGTVTATADPIGGGQAMTNMQPYTAFRYCIATQGTFPSR